MKHTYPEVNEKPPLLALAIRPKTIYAVLGLISLAALGGVLLSPELGDINGLPLSKVIRQQAIDQAATFRIADVAGKTPTEVTGILGKANHSELIGLQRSGCPCTKQVYRQGQIEIVYIKGKADWITVNLPQRQVDTAGGFLRTKAYNNPGLVYVQVATD